MERDELFDLLEIDRPEQLEYFEQFAELLENEGEIAFDDMYEVLSSASAENIGEFSENYFEELMNALPDSEQAAFAKLDAIQQRLMLLAADEGENARRLFVQEFYRFRDWYHTPGPVIVNGLSMTPMEALFECRADKLTGAEQKYDFSGFDSYELEELSMNLGNFSGIDLSGDAGDGGEA